ncbi:MAG: membrane protein insertase YidC [Clostridia bacterium]
MFYFIYNTIGFQNYGLSIIFITLIIKLALMPLSIKSIKSTQKMSSLAPEVEKIKQKYKSDQQKQSAEIQKLYKENNVSCMGGCLPMLLQFPVLIALYNVFRGVLTYVMGLSTEVVVEIAQRLGIEAERGGLINELQIVNFLQKNPEQFNLVSDLMTKDQLINLNFLGLNLGVTPSINPSVIFGPEMWTYLPLLIIPIIGVITVVISQKLSQPPVVETKKKTDEKNPAQGMQSAMKYMIPGMTLYFSFIFPAGLGLYWICTYLFQILQQFVVNKMNLNDKMKEDQKKLPAEVKPEEEDKKKDGGKKNG